MSSTVQWVALAAAVVMTAGCGSSATTDPTTTPATSTSEVSTTAPTPAPAPAPATSAQPSATTAPDHGVGADPDHPRLPGPAADAGS